MINAKNEFNIVRDEVSRFDNIIDNELRGLDDVVEELHKPFGYVLFRSSLELAISTMLSILILYTNRRIHSQGDSQTIQTKIFELIQRVNLRFKDPSHLGFILDRATYDLNQTKQTLYSVTAEHTKGKIKTPEPYIETFTNLSNLMITKIENFRKIFLDSINNK
jgi:hypothetical protein